MKTIRNDLLNLSRRRLLSTTAAAALLPALPRPSTGRATIGVVDLPTDPIIGSETQIVGIDRGFKVGDVLTVCWGRDRPDGVFEVLGFGKGELFDEVVEFGEGES